MASSAALGEAADIPISDDGDPEGGQDLSQVMSPNSNQAAAVDPGLADVRIAV